MTIAENASLKPYNTFGIDAKARFMSSFDGHVQLAEILNDPRIAELPFMVLGGGSNVLFTGDYQGLILKNEVTGIDLVGEDADHYYVKAGAGENWHSFVLHALRNGWAGLENLSLIPGNVGASPMQNIGAYGVEVKDRFHSLEAYEIENGNLKTFDAASCQFGYRESIFKQTVKGKYIILNVTFRLFKRSKLNTTYGAIADELAKLGISNPGINDVSRAVINIRNSKLPNPAELGNAGSFFKNPLISASQFELLQGSHPDIPHYPAPNGDVKLAAGWLIEHAGWKGKRLGNCGMHAKQALVLVNYGGATGEEIWAHSEAVKNEVYAKYGVELEREVNII
jgi:UDP-N-acetylmuramate dehydrogenase